MEPIFKSKNKILGKSLFLASSLLLTNISNAADFTFTPLSLSEQLARPGVGFQEPNRKLPNNAQLDFCIANGFTPGSAQSNSVGEVFNNRKNLEDAGIKTGSTYLRINWQQIEPNNNDWKVDQIHKFLECANKRGHAVDLRVMLTDPSNPDNTKRGLPNWVNGLMANEAPNLRYWSDFNNDFSYPVPNFNNPTLKREHDELIRKLGAEFNGHKDLNSVDIGSVGYWGEWHYLVGHDNDHRDFMPDYTTQIEIIELYRSSFPNTPKVALHGAYFDSVGQRVSRPPYTSTVAQHLRNSGTKFGWRGDSWGSWGALKPEGGFRSNFNERYNTFQDGTGIPFDNWKTGMVALEIQFNNMSTLITPGGITEGRQGENYKDSTQKAKDWHASTINSKQGVFPIDAGIRERSLDLSAKMGYRLVLKSGNYNSTTPAGNQNPLQVNMQWENQGIAPLYRRFVVAFRLRDTNNNGKIVFATKTGKSLKGLTRDQGEVPINPNMYIDGGVPSGTYALDTALVFSSDDYNVEKYRDDYSARIPIAIVNNNNLIKDKWVYLGNLEVTGGGTGVGFVPDTVGGSTGGGTDGGGTGGGTDGGGTGGNTTPTANPDNVVATSELKTSFYPLVNDIGNDKKLNTPNAWSQQGGEVRLINTNQITYRSKAGFSGTDKIFYVMRDSQGRTDSSEINITVNPVRAKANPDDMFATTGVKKSLYPLANDEGTGKSLLTPNYWTQQGGTVSPIGNYQFDYQSKAGFAGTDRIFYTMKDSQGRFSNSVINISVWTPGASAPVARADNYTTAKNTGKVLNILANDTANAVDQFIDELSSYTAKGGWMNKTSDGKKVWYKPKDGFTGEDSFWYVMMNSDGRKDSAQVKITVN